jgi:hypothetical protein
VGGSVALEILGHPQKVEVAHLPPGLYLLSIFWENGKVYSQKVVKQ